MITGQNFIGNKRSSQSQKTYRTFNPKLNKENEWVFTEADMDELNEAMALAVEAFKSYQKKSGVEKARFLNAICDEILGLGDNLINVYCAETGLAEGRAKGELGRTISQLKSFADLVENGSYIDAAIETSDQDRKPAAKPDLRKMLFPIGPVAVFGASNFPLAFSTAGGDTASALASGCPVIVKSHPMHAGTAELIASAIIEAAYKTGMPNGVFSLLNSSDSGVGQALVLHPDIKAVGFTGSFKGGRALHDLGSLRPNPIPVFAEMGSINPTILLPNALNNKTEELAEMYASSITLGAGQFCTNPGLIIAMKSESLKNFLNILGQKLSNIPPSCMLHPNIAKKFNENKEKFFDNDSVVQIEIDSNSAEENHASPALATVSATDFLQYKDLHEEIFGPFSVVVQCDDLEQMQEVVDNLEGQLTGSIISDSGEISNYKDIVNSLQMKVGRLIFNNVPTGVEVSPAMLHGGPYPASSDSRFTAVGTDAIKRWLRPVSFQDWPNEMLPAELKNENPLNISRKINGKQTEDKI